MKHHILTFCLCLAGVAAVAQSVEQTEASQRAAIAAQRQVVENQFDKDQQACYQKFAVNDCIKQAKQRRRVLTDDLHRQELSLNEQQRKRKGAEALGRIDQRRVDAADALDRKQIDGPQTSLDAEQKTEDAAVRSVQAPIDAQQRQLNQVERAQNQAEKQAERARLAASAPDQARRYQQKQVEAAQRRKDHEKKLKEKGPAAAPLPTPAN